MKRFYVFGLLFAFLVGLLGPAMPAAAAPATSNQAGGAQTYTVIVGAENVTHGITVAAFFPAVLHVHVGDTVFWKQNTHEIHTVTFLAGEALPDLLVPVPNAPPGAMMINPQVAFPVAPKDGMYDGSSFANSGLMGMDPGQQRSFSLTFTKAGTFEYLCVVHGVSMSGKIVVEDASATLLSPAKVSQMAIVDIRHKLRQGLTVYFQGMSQIKPPEKNSDGTWTHFVTVGFSKGQIDIMNFYPKQLVVHQGDTVEWDFSKMNMAPHTITFLNGAAEPDLVVAVPQPNGPPFLVINPAVALPQNTDKPLTRTGIYNSGLIDPAHPQSFSLKIGDITGKINYLCLLHDSSGMVASLVVMPRGK